MQALLIICILLALSLSFPADAAVSCGRTLTVSKSGSGGFSTIQAAVNAVPSNGKTWTCIRVKAGTYKEQVTIPLAKTFINLQGEGAQTTTVVYQGTSPIDKSATLLANADNLIVQKISFVNSYNYPTNSNPIKQAPAALLMGDKQAFYQSAFYGVQDTLWDSQGRHYFESCLIHGSVDFIFGAGQSLYQKCTISVTDNGIPVGGFGYITAQGRSSPKETNGFVFKDCTITGTGKKKAYLGRAWRPYARVVFYNTNMADIINPEGWDAWRSKGKESVLTFEEINCQGPGAMRSKRAPWSNKHSPRDLQKMLSTSFISGSTWLVSP